MAGIRVELTPDRPWFYWNTTSGFKTHLSPKMTEHFIRQFKEVVRTEHLIVLAYQDPQTSGHLILIHKDLIDGDT